MRLWLFRALPSITSLLLPAMFVGCGDNPASSSGGGTGGTTATTSTSTSTTPTTGGGGGGTGGTGGSTYDGLCPVDVVTHPPSGAANLRVAGEWNSFDLATATPLTGPDADGAYRATLKLQPGLQGYKVIYDQGGSTVWSLDADQGRRKYVGGVENSGIKVADCSRPSLVETSTQAKRPSAGAGTFTASLDYHDAIDESGSDTAGFTGKLFHEDEARALTAAELSVDPATGKVTVSVAGLEDGKYKVEVTAKSKSGHESLPLKLVFWIEATAFTWDGALIYMVMTDRYKDGDSSNNAAATPGADPRGDYQGGDLQGLAASIAAGDLDKLGVRAIWITPFQTNPQGAYPASDGVHQVTGYHGYWPIKARSVDPRIGGDAALHALVKEAHKHGIRILQDFVLNHVHEEHEYVKAHPEWFHTLDNGCVCGTAGCDWTEKALTCLFAPYLPDINHTVPEASAQFTSDGIFWLDEFNLDGLRVDAVKHVEEIATRNLSAEVRETFEHAGTHFFLMGETAMGWNDCNDPCNDENYGTISKYIGPHGLDGQFDFVLYHGVSYRTFAWGNNGFIHADYWTNHGLGKWPKGAVMTPYIGSHDTSRFATMADYRDQDPAHSKGIPGNQWDNTAVAPTDGEPYWRARVGFAWLLGLPGAPLMYYGDEYGQWGGADPNNRLFWRPEASLTQNEKDTLGFIRKVGQARMNIPALQRGAYVTLSAQEDTLVFGRLLSLGQAAIVGITRSATPQQVTVDGAALGLSSAKPLHDALGGPDVAVSGVGKVTLTIPARSAVVLAP
ncbi:MAG: alpha-amylase family glycosyl hydrolase [Polyangiaceae bacterium]